MWLWLVLFSLSSNRCYFFNEKMLENSTKNKHKFWPFPKMHFLTATLPYSDCECLPVLWDSHVQAGRVRFLFIVSLTFLNLFFRYCFCLVSMQTQAYLYSNQYIYIYSHECPRITHFSNWDRLVRNFKCLLKMRRGRHFVSLWEGVAQQWI